MKVSLFSSSLGGHRFSQHCSAVFSRKCFSGGGTKSDSFMPSVSLRAPILSDLNIPFKSRFTGKPNGIMLLQVNLSHLIFIILLYQADNVVTGKKCSEPLNRVKTCFVWGFFPPYYFLGEIKCSISFLKPASASVQKPKLLALVGFFPAEMNTGSAVSAGKLGQPLEAN